MRFPLGISSWLFLPALALVTSAICAQVQPDPCGAAVMAGDVSLHVSLKNGQAVFREGEIIALTAEYSSATEKKYHLSTRGYDRSGRLNGVEVFCVDPAAGRDPLADYFSEVMSFMGGGLGGEQDLGSKPYAIELELNEWQSLPPGSYRLSIVSQRVTAPTENKPDGSTALAVPLRSNEVEFQIVKAAPDWQREQLSRAESALDSAEATGEDARHAARVLRFLGSEAAARELARRFWSGNDQSFGWDLKFGLFGSPYRARVIDAMKAALHDPQHPVTQEFVQTLAMLEMQSDPKYRLPKYSEENKEEWIKAREAYSAAFDTRIADHISEIAATLQSKTGKARAVSVSELLQSDMTLNPSARAQLRQMLLASWSSLPFRQRNELIQFRWEQIGGPEFLPILRSIVGAEPNRNHEIDKLDRATALRRIYELAPGQGRELILREIANPAGDIGISVLGLLPERELPQVEQPLIAKLKEGNGEDLDFQMLERYGSKRALPDIQAIYEAHRGEWACAPQDAMLRYFLRVKPDYGVAQVSEALGQRKVTSCYKFQLTGVTEEIHRPQLEQIAIGALNDPSVEVATNAAEALGKYGSVKAQAALWARLEKFHERWTDRDDELHDRSRAEPDVLAEVRLEQVLVQAIANGQAWFTTEGEIQKLKALASPQMQPELDGVLQEVRRDEYGLNLNWWPEGVLGYSVGRYTGKGMAALKEKLAQFPSGTHVDLITTVAERDHHRAEFAEIEDAASANSLALQIQTSR